MRGPSAKGQGVLDVLRLCLCVMSTPVNTCHDVLMQTIYVTSCMNHIYCISGSLY